MLFIVIVMALHQTYQILLNWLHQWYTELLLLGSLESDMSRLYQICAPMYFLFAQNFYHEFCFLQHGLKFLVFVQDIYHCEH